jgi:hypothetical protein
MENKMNSKLYHTLKDEEKLVIGVDCEGISRNKNLSLIQVRTVCIIL